MTKASVKKTDKELISALKKGDKKVFGEIERRYHDKLFFYLRHLVRSKEEAEDLLQNVFLKAFQKMHTFDNRRQFSSWIYRIAHNEAINHLKRKNIKRFISWEDIVSVKDSIEMAADGATEPDALWARREISDEVNQALDQLPKKYREVIVLRYFCEKSYEEISVIVNKEKNTVGTLINRAKKRLVRIINEAGR